MIALTIKSQKQFMSAFLIGNLFDNYRLSEGSITTFCTFSIDGAWQSSFFENENTDETPAGDNTPVSGGELPSAKSMEYSMWSLLKPHVLGIIKGKRAPLQFRFVFLFPPEKIPAFINGYKLDIDPLDIFGMYLNIRFDGTKIILTTGSSRRTFSLDKSLDIAWDKYIRAYLAKGGIETEDVV